MPRKDRVLAFLVVSALCLSPTPRAQASKKSLKKTSGSPSIQISLITVSPNEIHLTKAPDEATVVVQVAALGQIPPHAVASVDVSTYSAHPTQNDISYSAPQTLPLKGVDAPTVFVFKVRSGPKMVTGSLIIAATILSATPGIKLIWPIEPAVWQIKLETTAP
jgi:hypothetical protein